MENVELRMFCAGRKGLVEKSSLIKHAPARPSREELQRMQGAERSTTNAENQAFLNDVSWKDFVFMIPWYEEYKFTNYLL